MVDIEKKRLIEKGRKDLTNKIKWVSKEQGDGLGYDIQSYDENGSVLFIEVKTTTGGKSTPFYLSHSELQKSREFGKVYRLYRVYNFNKNPQIFVLFSPLEEFCVLQPNSYRAKF